MSAVELIPVATVPGVRAHFTTRLGGVSTDGWASLNLGMTSGDDPDRVLRNRALLCDALGDDRIVANHQVHGSDVRRVDAADMAPAFATGETTWPDADGLVSDATGIGLLVMGADCLPVLAWRVDTGRIGAAHVGWRGLVAGILGNLVAGLGSADAVAVAIGPGIGPCCYPVSDEVRQSFRARFGQETVVGEAVDLVHAAQVDLTALGVTNEAIARYGGCTSCDARRFFSYRRDGARTGRHAGVIQRVAP